MSGAKPPRNLPVEAVAGFTAGCATTLVVHPLDLIKVRLQIDNKNRTHVGGILHVIRDLRQSQAPFKEAYRGLMPNLIGNTVSWGSYFFWYELIKTQVAHVQGHGELSFTDYLLSAGSSGCLTAMFTNPIWVLKTRMLSTSSTYEGAYNGTLDGLHKIWQNEGLRGFYRGFLPSLFGVGHGAVQLMFYEELKDWYADRTNTDTKDSSMKELSTLQYITFSALSKIGATLTMYPYQVIRSRLQRYDADNVYLSMRDVIRKTAKEEGIFGFYKGLLPNLFRVVPATCITFVVYENTRSYMNS
ncbi:mitochondrial carrier domain-containing protein [Lipomyces tetrasporus]|uniref:Mitochondrial carrier domain-containing protein n=1 Tax=Lipomyces tetrasporus TaxID=54092 RepID=A0AAD7QWR6_9ASCO|nr:mitochondrial carrier domain-containing protein [Lipomyces tetrasporus]KAJ8101237.1 mitochondrial carrier domain-containing protein [Lipomyces tetrasporus]